MTTVPEFVYKPMEERTLEELLETKKMQEAGIKKHSILAKWGNVESRARVRELRALKKRTEEFIKKLREA